MKKEKKGKVEMPNLETDKPARAPRKRDDRPKTSPKEDLNYRISGLEGAKQEPGMTGADIAALDRAIAKLREKKAEKEKPADTLA